MMSLIRRRITSYQLVCRILGTKEHPTFRQLRLVTIRGAACASFVAACMAWLAPFVEAGIEIDLNALGRASFQRGGGVIQPVVADVENAFGGGKVAMAFSIRGRNIGTDPIPWGFPVKETATTPWVIANKAFPYPFLTDNLATPGVDERKSALGYSAISEGTNDHAHDAILPAPPNAGENFYDGHPHLQMFIFRRVKIAAGFGPLEKITFSGLKHTFKTDGAGGNNSHFLEDAVNPATPIVPVNSDEEDTYGNLSNQDRDFLGPMNELNFTTFAVKDHKHFGNDKPKIAADSVNARNFNVYQRAHGEKEHVGDRFEHRLSVSVRKLLTSVQNDHIGNPGPAGNLPGTEWYFAASYFVPGEAVGDRSDNTAFRQFDPGPQFAAGLLTGFDPMWKNADSLRLQANGTFNVIPANGNTNVTGVFIAPMVPEPTGFLLFVLGLIALLGYGRRRRA